MSSTASSVTGSLPPYLQEALTEATKRAQELSRRPYTPYTGTRYQPMTASAPYPAAAALSRQSGSYEPDFQSARQGVNRGARKFHGVRAAYSTPYEREVTARIPQLAQGTFFNKFLPALQSKFSKPGRRGRHENMARDLNLEVTDDIRSQMAESRARAYPHALQAYDMDRARALEASGLLTRLGIARQAAQAEDIRALREAGAINQEQAQRALDLAYEQWKEEQRHPYERINQYLSILKGLPFEPSQFRSRNRTELGEPTMHGRHWQDFGLQAAGSGLRGLISNMMLGGQGIGR